LFMLGFSFFYFFFSLLAAGLADRGRPLNLLDCGRAVICDQTHEWVQRYRHYRYAMQA